MLRFGSQIWCCDVVTQWAATGAYGHNSIDSDAASSMTCQTMCRSCLGQRGDYAARSEPCDLERQATFGGTTYEEATAPQSVFVVKFPNKVYLQEVKFPNKNIFDASVAKTGSSCHGMSCCFNYN